jgi:hypothetical protein
MSRRGRGPAIGLGHAALAVTRDDRLRKRFNAPGHLVTWPHEVRHGLLRTGLQVGLETCNICAGAERAAGARDHNDAYSGVECGAMACPPASVSSSTTPSTAVLPTDNETRHGVLRPTMKRVTELSSLACHASHLLRMRGSFIGQRRSSCPGGLCRSRSTFDPLVSSTVAFCRSRLTFDLPGNRRQHPFRPFYPLALALFSVECPAQSTTSSAMRLTTESAMV